MEQPLCGSFSTPDAGHGIDDHKHCHRRQYVASFAIARRHSGGESREVIKHIVRVIARFDEAIPARFIEEFNGTGNFDLSFADLTFLFVRDALADQAPLPRLRLLWI